ncbi:MAG: thiamine-phosphate kinase [Chromatiaceae bacterium]|nr:thiamine-phosphate kinase [Chromatiaceae bacterium]MBP8289982.1 thiamine-phosphate kinase [Chromatiaceae bacterium]
MSEFALIRTHFARLGVERGDVVLGVGDDCALLRVPPDQELAVSIDTLVAGVHFLADVDPEALGHKCLAVGLSDLAAMGAEPAWATLALTLPAEDPAWLGAFAAGFDALARAHGVALVGGDTTRGPLSITVQVHGLVPAGRAIRRSGARPGDLVCVSGTLGDAGLALRGLLAGEPVAALTRARLERPTPRLALGLALRGLATAMIDVSDGLLADLGHILEESGARLSSPGPYRGPATPFIAGAAPSGAPGAQPLGADIRLADLPLSPPLRAHLAEIPDDWALPLASGDDYELCFTLPPDQLASLAALSRRLDCPLTPIGHILAGTQGEADPGLICRCPDGGTWTPPRTGFNHFPDPGLGP